MNLNFLDLWDRQRIQQKHWPVEDRPAIVAEHVAGIHEEAVELTKALGLYKSNYKTAHVDIEEVTTECVDIFKHLLSLMLAMGITSEGFVEAFFAKSDVVDVKWAAQADFDKPVVILDMDDVMASYSPRFDAYVEAWAQRKGLSNIDNCVTEAAKKEFRQSGGYLELKPVKGVKEGFDCLREKDCVIGILTARPGHIVKRVCLDTVRWLMVNGMMPDFIMWERDKPEALSMLRIKNPWDVLCVVEDNVAQVHSLSKHGYDVIWYGGGPKKIIDNWFDDDTNGKILCADNWSQVTEHIQILLNQAGGK
jgi:hypothetical protein